MRIKMRDIYGLPTHFALFIVCCLASLGFLAGTIAMGIFFYDTMGKLYFWVFLFFCILSISFAVHLIRRNLYRFRDFYKHEGTIILSEDAYIVTGSNPGIYVTSPGDVKGASENRFVFDKLVYRLKDQQHIRCFLTEDGRIVVFFEKLRQKKTGQTTGDKHLEQATGIEPA